MAYEALPPRDISAYGDPRDHGARCDLCPLAGNPFVPFAAPKKKLKLILVGEGPGRREEIMRTPFAGITGGKLDEELVDVGLDRDETYITNAALCASDNDKENERAAECCAPRLLKELTALPPDVPIVPLGKAAARTVLGVNSILLSRGFVWHGRDLTDSIGTAEARVRKLEKEGKDTADAALRVDMLKERHKLAGRPILPTLHPTFAFIHNETWAPIFSVDMQRIARWVRGELKAEHLIDRIERVKSLKELARRKRVFITTDSIDEIDAASKILGQEVGCDIETERRKPLTPLLAKVLTVQISDGDRSIVIAPWDAKKHAAVLSRFLKGRTVVFHNGYCFDQLALRDQDGVSFEGVNLEDTLTAHHTFASCYPQKLDHVVSTFTDSGPWKIRFGVRGAEEKGLAPVHSDDNELEIYGATDAVVTILAWRALQADLAKERSVYEFDKRRSELYASMQVVGYHVDRRRRVLLHKLLKRRAAGLVGRMRRIAKKPYFEPSKLAQVRKALFRTLKAPMLNPTPTGLAGTSNATLESLRTGDVPGEEETKSTRVARFAETLLNWRVTTKVDGTYLLPVEVHVDGRAHFNAKPFGVLTGRPAGRQLSYPRWSREVTERAREIFTAAPGHILVYFDLAQAEARFAANLSNDAAFLDAVATDVHTRNALILFPAAAEMLLRDPKGKYCLRHGEKGSPHAVCNCGKPFRDVTKNVGFAIIYQAGVKKVFAFLRSQGFPVELDAVEGMFLAMRDAYPDYDRYVQENMAFVAEHGYLRSALVGRIIWYGFHPEPAKIANCFDDETEALTQRGWVRGFDLQVGDKLLAKNPRTGEMTWEPISRLQLYERYTGPMYMFNSRSFNACTTTGHRWLVTEHRTKIDSVALTEELARGIGEFSIHRTGAYTAPKAPIYTDDFIELVGWLLTDGSINRSKVHISVYQSKRKNVRRIDALFKRLKAQPNRARREYGAIAWHLFAGSHLARLATHMFPARTLTPEFLLTLTASQLKLLLETMLLGDGGHETATPSRRRFLCRDASRRDAFQLLCTLCGIATSARWRGPSQPKKQYKSISNRPKSKGIWCISLLQRNTAQVIRHLKRYGRHLKRINQIRILPAGVERRVWCPVVKHTFFVVRRHGDVYISGNTPIQGGIADVMDTRLLDEMHPRLRGTGARQILHHYDSATFEVPKKAVEWVVDQKGNKKAAGKVIEVIEGVWAQPVKLKKSIVCRADREFLLPADIKVGHRWSDF